MATNVIVTTSRLWQNKVLTAAASAGLAVLCTVPLVRALDQPTSSSGSSDRAGMCVLLADATPASPAASRLGQSIADSNSTC